MKLKDGPELADMFVDDANKYILKEQFQAMAEKAFMVELARRYKWEITDFAIGIIHSILDTKSRKFFEEIKGCTKGLSKKPIKIDLVSMARAEKEMRRCLSDINFIQPGHGKFSSLYQVLDAALIYSESLCAQYKKDQKIQKNMGNKILRDKIKKRFYGTLLFVDHTLHLKFPAERDRLFKEFVEKNVLQSAKLSKILRNGIRLPSEETEVISFSSFMRSYNRNIS